MLMTNIQGFAPDSAMVPSVPSNRRNKYRLYVAYYSHGRRQGDDNKFHTALILAPKNPEPHKLQTWRYHVRNIGADEQDLWVYEGSPTMNGDQRIVALTFVCKVDGDVSGLGLSMLLRDVAVYEDEPDWYSRHWASSALQFLVDKKIIPQIHLSPRTIWKNGYNFAKSERAANHPLSIPTCDVSGKEIKSEVAWS